MDSRNWASFRLHVYTHLLHVATGLRVWLSLRGYVAVRVPALVFVSCVGWYTRTSVNGLASLGLAGTQDGSLKRDTVRLHTYSHLMHGVIGCPVWLGLAVLTRTSRPSCSRPCLASLQCDRVLLYTYYWHLLDWAIECPVMLSLRAQVLPGHAVLVLALHRIPCCARTLHSDDDLLYTYSHSHWPAVSLCGLASLYRFSHSS